MLEALKVVNLSSSTELDGPVSPERLSDLVDISPSELQELLKTTSELDW